jgi:uncharacterized protein
VRPHVSPGLITGVYDLNIQNMFDWSRIVGFEWDAGNARKNVEKHAVTQAEAEEAFFHRPLIVADMRHSASERRFHALGATAAGRRLHVTFTVRASGTLLRVISARDMSSKERAVYVQTP